MKRKLVTTTAFIHIFSRRCCHGNLRLGGRVDSAAISAGETDGGAALELEEDHEAGEGEHGDEEEEVVADDGADVAHLGGGGGKDAVLGELVEAADDELEGDEVEDDGGDAEEALQVDLDGAADEEDSEDYGYGDAEEGSGEGEELGGVEGDGGEDEDGLDAFAEDEEEDEEEEAECGRRLFADVGWRFWPRSRPSWSGRCGA